MSHRVTEFLPLQRSEAISQCFDELDRLEIVVEDELTTSNAAVDVEGGSGNEKSRVSRHGVPPMRGRDDLILHGPHHNATVVHW